VRKLQSQDPQKAQKFVTALELFYGQGWSMGEIAPKVNLQAQFQVSRLLKLKSFRADIQQRFLVLLRDRVINEALAYTDPERLQALNEQIEEALDEQVTQVMQEAAKEASTATSKKNQTTTTSLFAKRLCHCLHLSGFMS
jgi:predicted RNase H-like nuclease